ncbi:TetR/AcrR family transcriptional regulator [Nonomuraea turkmeniaca]|uniref:TetR/AcrR family transcriptional regulator n=1 Tax=Nonomuraea turkmeniaca TaxID=103838 RepID=UPI001476C81C
MSQGKREAVLDAEVEPFLAGGFDGTSMDAAGRAGVSKTTVDAHFGDKVELFHAVAERGPAVPGLLANHGRRGGPSSRAD